MVANASEELRFFNGFGGFSADGTEYVIRLDATPSGLRWPPMPWSNVIANENAGCIVTGAGAVTSWSANSRENRLTPWFNDPVSDPFGEAIYLRDDDSGVFWSPLPGPTPAPAPYEARHGFGYSTWRHTSHELEQTTTTWFPRHDPVKIVRLKLRSTSLRARTITVTSYAHLVLGGVPWATAPDVVTSLDEDSGAMLATNPSRGEFSKRVTFAALVAPSGASKVSATGDRTAFLGRTGSVSDPAALHADGPLDGRTGAGLDPCAAFRTTLTIPPGATVEIVFLLGEAESELRARSLLKTYESSLRHEQVARHRSRVLARHARRRPDRDAVARARPDGERLARLSESGVPRVGEVGVLSVGRRVRISRSAPGLGRAALSRAVAHARADPAARGASVRRRRRAALVASAHEQGHPHAILATICSGCRTSRRSTSRAPATRRAR